MAEADPKIETRKQVALAPAFAVRLDAFLRVKPFVSKEETRYYLNGIAVQPAPDGSEGAVCIATDGHRLGVRRDAAGRAWQNTICRVPAELKLPRKGLFNGSPWLVCMAGGGKGHLSLVEPAKNADDDNAEYALDNIEDCIMRFGSTVIDGTFPDWARLVPNKKKSTRVGFNGEYLKSFGRDLEISGEGKLEPYVIQDDADTEFFGILMPARFEAGDIPAWLRVPK